MICSAARVFGCAGFQRIETRERCSIGDMPYAFPAENRRALFLEMP